MDASDKAAQQQKEAAQNTIRHTGPTADRYAAALERYVNAVAGDSAPAPRSEPRARHFPPMTVSDVMSRSVVSAYRGAPFKEIATALHRNRINSVPVIDEERHVVGVVTASDLLARVGHARPLPRGHRPGHQEKRYKVHAATAAELMTSPAITATPSTSIADAARLLARYRVRSLPVVDRKGVLMGMVSRADLIELFIRSDRDIAHDIERDVLRKSTHVENVNVHVTVEEGVARLTGRVNTALTARGLAHRAALVPGVVDVEDTIEFDVNDLYVPTRH